MSMNPDPFSLDRLRDIATHPPVSFWPPAPVWFFVLALVIWWTSLASIKVWLRWKRDAYRRQALAELRMLASGNIAELSSILKRVALVAYPRGKVASLSGHDWTDFLTTTCDKVDFTDFPENQIGIASFDPSVKTLDANQWNRLTGHAERWIERHVGENQR